VEFKVERRKYGKTKWNWFKLFQLSLDAITSYSSKPLHIVTILGICTFLFSFILGVQTLYNKLFGYAITGFTTVILITLFFSSIIMISMGILGLYISKIFKEVKSRPSFIIDTPRNVQRPNKKNVEPKKPRE
jgi:dolichol-phosphate mannosyltransferase